MGLIIVVVGHLLVMFQKREACLPLMEYKH